MNVTNFVKSFLFSLLHIVSYFGRITAGFCGSLLTKFDGSFLSSACENNQKPPAKSNNKPNPIPPNNKFLFLLVMVLSVPISVCRCPREISKIFYIKLTKF